jgi:hypothetical protein
MELKREIHLLLLLALVIGSVVAGYLFVEMNRLKVHLTASTLDTGDTPASADVKLQRSVDALRDDVKRLQQELGDMRTRQASTRGMALARQRTDAIRPEVLEDESEAHEPTILETQAREHPLIEQYRNDWSQSDWGTRNAASIDQAALVHEFFRQAGGEVVSNCKQTACRVEWLPETDAESRSPQANDQDLARARYELLALVARSADDVGQMTTEWVTDGASPTLAVTFQRGTPQ